MKLSEAKRINAKINQYDNGWRTLRECAELAGTTREAALQALDIMEAYYEKKRRTKKPESSR